MPRSYSVLVTFIAFGFSFFAAPVNAQLAPREGYKGVVIKSDNHKEGDQFAFANLQAARPFVTFPRGNGAETTKVFEDGELFVLIFVASITGSTETFYLNKKTGRFTLVEVGALEATTTGIDFRPSVTYGKLK